MEESITFAKKYLEDLLSFFGLNTDVYATHEDDVIELSVPSTHLNGFLIGQRGDTLRSIQFLVSTALKNNDHEYVRVNVDIADYKRHRYDRIAHKTEDWIKKVKDTKEKMALEPMNAADRRIVHRTVGEARGVESESEGEGRDRHVVISPIIVDDEEESEED
ncbi:MAG: R3H domain-containing nucleic acid-binding protein [Candidatus Saccharimonadales bacterium]|nr:R3H domain-containing nucleic acid-binding protein [Candidatus Saccharimonadales bacterium]